MNKSANPINRLRIEPQSGIGFRIKNGETIRIIDVEGEQVVDLFCFSEDELEENLSSGHTTDYNGKIYLSKGDVLYSNRSNPMFTIIEDQVGGHIMLYAPCSQKMFEKSYGVTDPHPNCLENLVMSLAKYGIQASQITVPFNIFMSVGAGETIELRAEMDMIVGVTACSAGACNNYKWTPIDVEINTAR
jgi:uncharacterized protein YcgI (DUF1989 family)